MPNFKNFRDFEKALMKKVEKASGNVALTELLDDRFMNKYTDFSTLDNFFEAAPFKFETEEEFVAIPETEKDEHVKATTRFNSWNDMLGKAGEEYFERKLKF